MRVAWTRRAIRRLDSIHDFISQDSPSTAERVVGAIYDRTNAALRENPYLGRRGIRPGTREFVLANIPYFVVYRVTDRVVDVLTVRHTAQDPDGD